MIKIGEYNKLQVIRKTKDVCYLTDNNAHEAILILNREVSPKIEIGEKIDVFIYSDSEHPYIATLLEPKIKLHEFAFLKATAVNEYGAFLDWGLAKDLFVPFAEQKRKMEEDRWYVIYLFLDEHSGRLVGSNKLNKFLDKENHDIQIQDEVDLLVAERTKLGFNVIINNKAMGLLFESEIIRPLRIGERLKGYIKNIRQQDNKIDVWLRKPGYEEVNKSEKIILDRIKANEGFLGLTDNSDSEEIRKELEMSKKTFKKAIGVLYKQRLIRLEKDGIYLIKTV